MDDLLNKILEFRSQRDWRQFHNPKDLSISVVLEASELLENFQWKNNDEAIKNNLENIKKEIADVFIYLLLLSHELDVDIKTTVLDKIKENEKKYPIEKAMGSNKKYTDL